ncbi:hypothetical protein VP01_2667g2 [Puccinia sorghi]|uniref:Uncharacterized protein n=1 Tax=Puccinia sorghi TaxID=27349 RepID=A0A0L6V3Y2_9BASI|nr:hypothetical protein VP01_2667g2 [Puccinia sorghi]
MSASADLTASALPTLNAMAMSFNVYPMVLKYFENRIEELGSPSILAYILTLIIVHGILLIQATLTLVLKLSCRAKSGKLWLWRKQHLLDQEVPYLIPNGHFIIEPLQILGCIFFELSTLVAYIAIRWPDVARKLPALHATCLFWIAVSCVPGFIGFWWSGWSAFYALFLTPTHASRSSHGQIARTYHNPILMNVVCMGVPVLISLFFIIIGIFLTAKHEKAGEIYATFSIQLRHLSETWKPNDPNTVDNNRRLSALLQRLLSEAGEILHTLQCMAIGWAITAITIVTVWLRWPNKFMTRTNLMTPFSTLLSKFYVGTAISVGKVTQRTLKMATGRATLITYASKDTKSVSQLDSSGLDDGLELRVESNHFQVSQPSHPSGIKKSVSALSLRRNLYLLRASCGLMVIYLGFNFCISIIIATKAPILMMS